MHMQKKLGIIAGRGWLPRKIIEYCIEKNQDFRIIFLKDNHDVELYKAFQQYGDIMAMGMVGHVLQNLRKYKVTEVVFAGAVTRPSFNSLLPDWLGLKLIGRLTTEKLLGDNKVLTTITNFCNEQGFSVVGADEIIGDILAPAGLLTRTVPNWEAENGRLQRDMQLGIEVLRTLSDFDIGQAVVVQQGRVMALEAAEGTDGLIQRSQALLYPQGSRGVLIKLKKMSQSSQVDLPTIGLVTIQNMVTAGMGGLIIQADATIILNPDEVIRLADEHGIFIFAVSIDDNNIGN